MRTRRSSLRSKAAARLSFCRVAGRCLIGLAAVVLVISPFTEAFATFDNYPRGGPDFELSIFFLIALLCMTVLAVFLGLGLSNRLLDEPSWEPHEFWIVPLNLFSCFLSDRTVWVPPKQLLCLGVFAAPLRI